MEYHEHDVVWTSDKVARFWDFMSRQVAARGNYFTRQVGDGVVRLVAARVGLRGPAMDYGAGDGSLIHHLLEAGVEPLYACDFSADSVNAVNVRFAGDSRFNGCFRTGEIPRISFGCVFLIEAIEHMSDEAIKDAFNSIAGMLAENGILVVTTPNTENLDEGKVACPECGAVFHRMQHMTSFTSATLSTLLVRHGFMPVFCKSVHLADFRPGHVLPSFMRRAIRHLRHGALPHLVAIARKANAGQNGDRR